MTNQQDYDQAVIAVARGETVPNLNEIIAHSRFCRDAFDSHVRQERQRIAAESNPPPSLGALGRERAARIRERIAAAADCNAQPPAT